MRHSHKAAYTKWYTIIIIIEEMLGYPGFTDSTLEYLYRSVGFLVLSLCSTVSFNLLARGTVAVLCSVCLQSAKGLSPPNRDSGWRQDTGVVYR